MNDDVPEGILNMRDGPGVGHKVIVPIHAGASGLRLGACRSPDDKTSRFKWCRVAWGGYSGWVSSCCITKSIEAVRGGSSATQYPLVFTSVLSMKQFGIALDMKVDKSIHFNNRCYYYGDGGWDISVSDEFLQYYKERGFSRRSLCLALVSGITFNPETGARLATYVLVNDMAALRANRQDVDTVSDELPLSIPDCFKRALPYSDCEWNFDPLSGQRLRAGSREKFRRKGQRLEEMLAAQPDKAAKLADKNDLGEPTGGVDHETGEFNGTGDSELIKGSLAPAGYHLDTEHKVIDGQPTEVLGIASVFDYSDEFPKGYGYALYANGAAAPAVSPDVAKAARDGLRRRSQVNVAFMRSYLSEGSRR
ncbi:MAG: SH3 domain-containing protein [Rhodomicrobium sp.]